MDLPRGAQLKARLRGGEPTFGAWLTFPSPALAELMSGAGFDWVAVDMEHTAISLESLEAALIAFNGRSTATMVRVPTNESSAIGRVLDLGADGVIIPHVNSAQEAERAVAACRYPPSGARSFGPKRASDYYRHIDRYLETANDSVIVAVQVEDLRGVGLVRQIVAVPGVDVVALGPADLAASMGLLGRPDDPKVQEAIGTVIAACREVGMTVGIPARTTARALEWVSRGCQFIFTGHDHAFLREAMERTLAELHDRRAPSTGL